MLSLVPALALFILCIFLFFRECRLDRKKAIETERLDDEQKLREIERFKRKVGHPPYAPVEQLVKYPAKR